MENCFKQLVLSRQSCRNFNDKPIEKQTVLDIAKLAMLAPSACNSQPWKMYVVTDLDKVNGVAKSLQDYGHNTFTDKAKAFIVLTEQQATLKESVSQRFSRNHFVKYDIGELTAYITLGAQSMGVSSCIIGLINQEKLRNVLNLKEDEVSNIVVALGYSDIAVRNKIRKSESDVITLL